MLSADQVRQVIGSTAYGSDGKKIGKVGQVYFDDGTDEPEWVTINTGLFGTSESFVPLADATFDGDRLTVGYLKETVKGAPSVDDDGQLSPEQERSLYDYYRRGWEDYVPATPRVAEPTDSTASNTSSGTDGDQTSEPSNDGAITRSEERLDVDTRTQVAGRARLRKWVDTEYVNMTIPVRRQKAALETERTGDDMSGPELSAPEQREVILSEERPVVSTTVQPVQRVRLGKETVTDEQTVTEHVRKEHVEIDSDADDDRKDEGHQTTAN